MANYLTFASPADMAAIWGAAFLALALVALMMERRRSARSRIDRVGLVPWTGLFLASAVVGGGLLAMAIPALLRG